MASMTSRWLQQLKAVSLLTWRPDCCSTTDLNNCETVVQPGSRSACWSQHRSLSAVCRMCRLTRLQRNKMESCRGRWEMWCWRESWEITLADVVLVLQSVWVCRLHKRRLKQSKTSSSSQHWPAFLNTRTCFSNTHTLPVLCVVTSAPYVLSLQKDKLRRYFLFQRLWNMTWGTG